MRKYQETLAIFLQNFYYISHFFVLFVTKCVIEKSANAARYYHTTPKLSFLLAFGCLAVQKIRTKKGAALDSTE